MGLRDLSFPAAEVQTSGGPLAVRGMSLDNILSLFYRHRDELLPVFESVIAKAQNGGEADGDDMLMIAADLIGSLPMVVAEIITLASGISIKDEDFDALARAVLAFNVAEQIDALEKIAQQTFTSDMPPGKMFALIRKMIQSGSSLPAAS
jgi:hypothetical protein